MMERDIDGGAFLINCQLGKVSQITRALKYHDQVERLIQYTDPYFRWSSIISCATFGQILPLQYILEEYQTVVNKITNEEDYVSKNIKELALINACAREEVPVITYLVVEERVNTFYQDPDGMTALICACNHGHVELVQFLLEIAPQFANDSGVNQSSLQQYINAKDREGRNALMYACGKGHLPIVEYITSTHPVDLESVDADGRTALMIACHLGHVDIIHFLIEERKANIFTKTKTGASLLLIACTGKLSIVRMLVDKYAIMNPAFLDEPGQDGLTPLLMACCHGKVSIVEYLLQFREHIDLTRIHNGKTVVQHYIDNYGKTAMDETFPKVLKQLQVAIEKQQQTSIFSGL